MGRSNAEQGGAFVGERGPVRRFDDRRPALGELDR